MSSPFTLDNSGSVFLNNGFPYENAKSVTWDDLTPFAQGYIEALFAGDIYHVEGIMIFDKKLPRGNRFWAFSDLSPEALATILADCETVGDYGAEFFADDPGASFWLNRQRGWPAWADRRGVAHTSDPDVRKARKAELAALALEARALARLI